MLLNRGVGENSWEPLDCKESLPVNPKGNQSWIFIGRTDAEAPILSYLMWRTASLEKTLMLGKIEGRRRMGRRGWDGWMASPTQYTWVWIISASWWWTRKPGMLQSMGSQRVGYNWGTVLYWIDILIWGFSVCSDGKESAYNAGDLGLIPGSGRSAREGNSYPLQCSCLENSTEREAWQDTVHGVVKS